MRKQRKTSGSEQGFGAKLSAKGFFLENNSDGISNATPFLDFYDPMKATPIKFSEHEEMWQNLKEGWPIDGVLKTTNDKRSGAPYIWVSVKLPRGVQGYRVDVFSDKLLEFFKRYQKLKVSTDFTLKDLMDEAERIESLEVASN
ncbi:hypothetical protein [Desertivirga xinjiangensis]|uniref:hypothetical protein n=1 Tax=Desertivirga xinjiangensis TaxID=539206 RepID=UPI00210BEF3F|nr:hypothetical protein [Pedobacter xinjiangensis]